MSYAHRDTLERLGVTQHRLAAPVEVILMVVDGQRMFNEQRVGMGQHEHVPLLYAYCTSHVPLLYMSR